MLARFRSTARPRTIAPTLVLATLACPALAQDAVLESARDGGTRPVPPPPPAVEIVPNTPPPKEHDQDALAVLDEAEKAIDELESFRATLALSATQWSRDFADQGEVSVVARRSPEDREQWQIRLAGELMPERSRDRISIDAFFDGQRMRWVDPKEERIGARILPVRMRTTYFDTPIRLRDRLFTSGKAIEEVRSSTRVYLDERQTIDGVECEVVVGEPGDGGFRFELFVGVEDHLPRRYVHRIDMTQMGVRGTSVADFKDLEPGVRVSDAAFVIPVPDGWFEEQFPRPVTPGVPVPGNTTEDGTTEGDGDGAMAAEADGTVSGGDDSDENQARINTAGATNQGADPNSSALTASSGDGSTVASTSRPTTPRTGPAPTGEIEIAPDFALRDKDGQTVRLSELAGQRVVIVFWGSWNPWARSLLGELRPALEDAENTRLLVLGVRERSEAAAREQFDRQAGPGTLLLEAERVAADYKVDAVPTVVVVDENGRVLLRHVGFTADRSPVERVRAILGISGG